MSLKVLTVDLAKLESCETLREPVTPWTCSFQSARRAGAGVTHLQASNRLNYISMEHWLVYYTNIA